MNMVSLVLITFLILLIGHYIITITNFIINWIYFRYMRPLKIEDARIASEDQLLDEDTDEDDAIIEAAINETILDEPNENPHDENMFEKDEVEDFIDYSRHNQSDEDEHYNYYFSVN